MSAPDVPDWSLDDIHVPFRLIVTSKTNTGKSHYALWVLYWLCDQLDQLCVMCPTLDKRDFDFATVTSPEHIFREYDPETLESLWNSQQSLIDKGARPPHICLLIDDCIFAMKKTDPVIGRIFTSGRHVNLSIIVISQKFRLLQPAVRANADFIVIGKIVNSLEKKALYDEYGIGEWKDFLALLRSSTQNFGMLVIDNVSTDEHAMLRRSRAPKHVPAFFIEESVRRSKFAKLERRSEEDDEFL
jgi:Poxvirus A32 protein